MNYEKILNLIINEIIPPTYENVSIGNKIFGGAIVREKDLWTVCVGLNNEVLNPLLHG